MYWRLTAASSSTHTEWQTGYYKYSNGSVSESGQSVRLGQWVRNVGGTPSLTRSCSLHAKPPQKEWHSWWRHTHCLCKRENKRQWLDSQVVFWSGRDCSVRRGGRRVNRVFCSSQCWNNLSYYSLTSAHLHKVDGGQFHGNSDPFYLKCVPNKHWFKCLSNIQLYAEVHFLTIFKLKTLNIYWNFSQIHLVST